MWLVTGQLPEAGSYFPMPQHSNYIGNSFGMYNKHVPIYSKGTPPLLACFAKTDTSVTSFLCRKGQPKPLERVGGRSIVVGWVDKPQSSFASRFVSCWVHSSDKHHSPRERNLCTHSPFYLCFRYRQLPILFTWFLTCH